MLRTILLLAMLLVCRTAVAQDQDDSVTVHYDARAFALSFQQGRFRWRIEALDLLQLPVVEPFDGIVLDEEVQLTQELLDPGIEFDDERRFFLTFTIGW